MLGQEKVEKFERKFGENGCLLFNREQEKGKKSRNCLSLLIFNSIPRKEKYINDYTSFSRSGKLNLLRKSFFNLFQAHLIKESAF